MIRNTVQSFRHRGGSYSLANTPIVGGGRLRKLAGFAEFDPLRPAEAQSTEDTQEESPGAGSADQQGNDARDPKPILPGELGNFSVEKSVHSFSRVHAPKLLMVANSPESELRMHRAKSPRLRARMSSELNSTAAMFIAAVKFAIGRPEQMLTAPVRRSRIPTRYVSGELTGAPARSLGGTSRAS